MITLLEYEVRPCGNVPAGLPTQRLTVLSPVWLGPSLRLEFPDGEVRTLVGWTGPGAGKPCELRVFWTRHEPSGPAVCLAIGGDAGVREVTTPESGAAAGGLPFLALAASLIPAVVLEVIGPEPLPAAPEVLLLG
jgi:hypothetical protein